jgi:hypothetical protein
MSGPAIDPELVFTEASVRVLLRKARVRDGRIDVEKLQEGLIAAARNYVAARGRDGNRLHREIRRLNAAVRNKRFTEAATALAALSEGRKARPRKNAR